MTTRPPLTPDELKVLYPSGLKLRLVQILFRHGERTPVSTLFQHIGPPAFWPYCRSSAYFKATILNHKRDWSELDYRRKIETFGRNNVAAVAAGPGGQTDDLCILGELTDKGRESTLKLGQRIRHLYVEQLNFLPQDMSIPSNFYLRSSPLPRTLTSLQQVISGLYPRDSSETLQTPLTILTRLPEEENLYPNDANCRRLSQLEQAFGDLAAKKWNDSPEIKYLQKRIGKYVNGKLAVDGHPRLFEILDIVDTTSAHGPLTKLPPEFYEPEVRKHLDTINVDEWYRGYAVSSEYRKLGIGTLLADFTDRMVDATLNKNGKDGLKLALYCGHDTTVGATLASLGAFDGIWPPYTSNIAFELFSRPAVLKGGDEPFGWRKWLTKQIAQDEYFVRLRYNDKPVTIPGCQATGNHLEGDETFCTLEAFKRIIEKLKPTDREYECRQNLDATGIPPEEPVPMA